MTDAARFIRDNFIPLIQQKTNVVLFRNEMNEYQEGACDGRKTAFLDVLMYFESHRDEWDDNA